jgi:hypothetical protein
MSAGSILNLSPSEGTTGQAVPGVAQLLGYSSGGTLTGVAVSAGLPVSLNQIYYPSSAANSSTVQLAAGASFTGSIETILSLQAAQIEIVCDQPYTVTINQYIDAAGTKLSSTDVFTIGAGVPFSQNVTLPGNYFNLVVTNNGVVPTTTLTINTTFGIMDTLPRTLTLLGNARVALNEVGGTALTLGQKTSAGSIPVVLPSDQVVIVQDTDSSVVYSATLNAIGYGTSIDTSGAGAVTFQFVGSGFWNIGIEGSNNNTNWAPVLIQRLDSNTLTEYVGHAGNFAVKTSTRYLRLNVRAIVGTATVTAVARNTVGPSPSDLLALALDSEHNVQMNVNLASGLKTDAVQAMVPSDAPLPITIQAAVNTPFIIDTQGYSTLHLTTAALAGALTCSNDKVTWSALQAVPIAIAAPVSSIVANTGYVINCSARYIRIVPTTAGTAVGYLRAAAPALTTSNIAFVGNSLTASPGLAGAFAVGGGTAAGAATSMYPVLVGGVDTGALVRRLLTDTAGRLAVAADQVGSGVRAPSTQTSYLNGAALNIQDTSQFEGQSFVELLAQILLELRIMNQYMYDLPETLQSGYGFTSEPQHFRADTTVFNL